MQHVTGAVTWHLTEKKGEKMPITKNNFSHVTNFELEGVDLTILTVDFINTMVAETADLSSGSAVAGLEATRATIMARCNILAEEIGRAHV